MSLIDAAPAESGGRAHTKHRCAGLGIDEMADELKRYWFVAGVFREPHDLVAPIVQLRASGIAGHGLLVIANQRAEDARRALDGSEAGRVPVIAAHYKDGAMTSNPCVKLSDALSALLGVMGDDGVRSSDQGDGRSQVYGQLRQDVDEGAIVLIASVSDPDEQLVGARILLRGNCACVLTHEIAA